MDRKRWGRFLSFLYIWQLSFSAPLSIASGCVGLAQYGGYLWPALRKVYFSYQLPIPVPFVKTLPLSILLGPGTLVAMVCCAIAAALLYRNIQSVTRFSGLLWLGVMGTMMAVILTGLLHFHASLAFGFPPGAFQLSSGIFYRAGRGVADCHLRLLGRLQHKFSGRRGARSRANDSASHRVVGGAGGGSLPADEYERAGDDAVAGIIGQAGANARLSVAAVVVQRAYGAVAGRIVAALVVWTAFASVYALLLGYSRVPYAAALDDNYFRIFAHVHPRHRIPNVSLLMLAGVSMVFCVLQLGDLVAALVVIRILLQFLLQQVGVMVLRHTQPEMERPFRIWFYPLPPLVAIAGFLYILFSRPHFAREIFFAMVVVLTGTVTYLLRAWRRREWPFSP